jgi:magnesium-transporting ATPase (P-type)
VPLGAAFDFAPPPAAFFALLGRWSFLYPVLVEGAKRSSIATRNKERAMKPRHGWEKGLSSQEAATRLKRDGENELPSAKPRGLLAIALEVVREPMFLLLIAAPLFISRSGICARPGVVRVGLRGHGDHFYQERKTERALEALRDLSSPRALVVRDGEPEAHRGAAKWCKATCCCSREATGAGGCAAARVQ